MDVFYFPQLKKQISDLGLRLKKELTKMKAREAGSVLSEPKMGSLCHVVGTKASLGEYRDHTYYYKFLETKQV